MRENKKPDNLLLIRLQLTIFYFFLFFEYIIFSLGHLVSFNVLNYSFLYFLLNPFLFLINNYFFNLILLFFNILIINLIVFKNLYKLNVLIRYNILITFLFLIIKYIFQICCNLIIFKNLVLKKRKIINLTSFLVFFFFFFFSYFISLRLQFLTIPLVYVVSKKVGNLLFLKSPQKFDLIKNKIFIMLTINIWLILLFIFKFFN